MRAFFCLLVLLIVNPMLQASTPEWLMNTYSRSMGHILSVDNAISNPSNLSLEEQTSININYSNDYLCKELSSLQAAFIMPNDIVDWGALTSYYGYSNYNELHCGISVSKLLVDNFSLGVRLLYYRMDYIGNEDVVNRVTADVGLSFNIVDNLDMSMLLTNPIRVRYTTDLSKYYLPIYMALGLSYTPTERVKVQAEVAKDTNYPIEGKIALSYHPVTSFDLRVGICSSPFIPTLGVGLKRRKFNIDVASSYHPELGFSPSIGIVYIFK